MTNLLRKRNLLSGLIATLILSSVVLFIFFGSLLKNPNETFFANDHDGLQNYYGHIFHIKYDSSYLHTSGMNYPYGEMIYYTGVQLVPANIIKFISDHIIDLSGYVIGLQNLGMLFSIVIAAVFLFLIFAEMKVGKLFASISAVSIAFLSPQLDRFGGHFSLTISFFVPLIIYLILKFSQTKRLYLSLIIGFVFFWAYTTHPYFFAINAALVLFFWIFTYSKDISQWRKYTYHLFLQLILPYLVVQFFSFTIDPVTDRTQAPWGLLFYRAYPEGIFLPFGRPYGQFLSWIFPKTDYIQWEGVAYVGLVGIFAFFMVLRYWTNSIIHKRFAQMLMPTNDHTINAMFWGAMAALLYSFGIPFILGLEWLVNYIGPLKQLRGIGRFAWAFFYVINIMGVYFFWLLYQRKKNILFLILPLALLSYDAYLNIRWKAHPLNNKFPAITDSNNRLKGNEWMHQLNPGEYQAIIPLPYYHLGSENMWISPTCNSLANSLMVSLKTGLPTTGIYMSRTSISQSFNNIQVVQEPYRSLSILEACKNKKPFLVVVSNCDQTKDSSYWLVKHSKHLYTGERFSLYELPFYVLENCTQNLYPEAMREFHDTMLLNVGGLYSTNSKKDFVYQSFDTLTNPGKAYLGNGLFIGDARNYQTVYFGNIPEYDPAKAYQISFWFGNILKDTYLRSGLIISKYDSKGNMYKEDYYNMAALARIFDGNWALCELDVALENPDDKVKVTLRSEEILNNDFLLDELIIKQVGVDLYKEVTGGIIKNNRYYLK